MPAQATLPKAMSFAAPAQSSDTVICGCESDPSHCTGRHQRERRTPKCFFEHILRIARATNFKITLDTQNPQEYPPRLAMASSLFRPRRIALASGGVF